VKILKLVLCRVSHLKIPLLKIILLSHSLHQLILIPHFLNLREIFLLSLKQLLRLASLLLLISNYNLLLLLLPL